MGLGLKPDTTKNVIGKRQNKLSNTPRRKNKNNQENTDQEKGKKLNQVIPLPLPLPPKKEKERGGNNPFRKSWSVISQ